MKLDEAVQGKARQMADSTAVEEIVKHLAAAKGAMAAVEKQGLDPEGKVAQKV
jgi:hypothetical protein